MKHRRRGWEQEERDRGRPSFQPHWEQEPGGRRQRRRQSGDGGDSRGVVDDRPRLLMVKHSKDEDKQERTTTPTSPSGHKPQDRPPKNRTEEEGSGDVTLPAAPQPRPPPKRIMIRNLSERSTEDSTETDTSIAHQEHTSSGMERTVKSASSSGSTSSPVPADGSEKDGAPKPKVAWDIANRGPVTSRTLYEPEGKKSVQKFNQYRQMTAETRGGGRTHKGTSVTSKGNQTRESPENSSAGILGEAPMAPDLLEKVQLQGFQQRPPRPEISSASSPSPQQQRQQHQKNKKDMEAGRPLRRPDGPDRQRGPGERGRRRDSQDGVEDEKRGAQRRQQSSEVKEEIGDGAGRRPDTDTRPRERERGGRDGRRERDTHGPQDPRRRQEPRAQAPKAGRERPQEPKEKGEGRRSRQGTQEEREPGRAREKPHRERFQDADHLKDRHQDRNKGQDPDRSRDKNRDHRGQDVDLTRDRNRDQDRDQHAERPRDRIRDQTRDQDTEWTRDRNRDQDRERDRRKKRPPPQEERRRPDDSRGSRQQLRTAERRTPEGNLSEVEPTRPRKRTDVPVSAKPLSETSKELPNRSEKGPPSQEWHPVHDGERRRKGMSSPTSKEPDRERERPRWKERDRKRDGGKGEERRGKGQPHPGQQEQPHDRRPQQRQSHKREDGEAMSWRQQQRERNEESGTEGDIHSRSLPPQASGGRRPERQPVPGRGRGRGGQRRERSEFARNAGKTVVGYEGLDDIESLSDWEEEEEQWSHSDQTSLKNASRDVPSSSESARRPHRDDRQRPPSSGGERDGRRERGGGRGRGRGRPQSQRPEQPGRRGDQNRLREQQGHEPKSEAASRPQAPSARGGDVGRDTKQNRKTGVGSQEPNKLEESAHKSQDISRYDVNSYGVVVVDEEADGEVPPQSPLVPGDSDGFQVVRTKREKQKDKEEKKRMEEKERRRDRDQYRQQQQQGDAPAHGSSLPSQYRPNLPLSQHQPAPQASLVNWGLPSLTDANKSAGSPWRQQDWTPGSEFPLNVTPNPSFGAVGEKLLKEHSYVPSSAPQPCSAHPNQEQSYQLFEPHFYSHSPRIGDKLMAAVDQSISGTPLHFTGQPQVPTEKPSSLSEMLEGGRAGDGSPEQKETDDGGQMPAQRVPQGSTSPPPPAALTPVTMATDQGNQKPNKRTKVKTIPVFPCALSLSTL